MPSNLENRLIAISRVPGGLSAIVSCVHEDKRGTKDVCSLEETTLTCYKASPSAHGLVRRLQYIFDNLGHVQLSDVDSMADVITLLKHTVPPAQDEALTLEPLTPMEVAAPRPTAKHPRAFKGTKQKPKKAASEPYVDLQPYLSSERGIKLILSAVRPIWREIVSTLSGGTPGIIGDMRVPDSWLELHLRLSNYENSLEPSSQLPRPFIRYLLPSVVHLSTEEISKTLKLYYALRLSENTELLALVARILVENPSARGVAWCDIISVWTEDQRANLAAMILETGAHSVEPLLEVAKLIGTLTDKQKMDLSNRAKGNPLLRVEEADMQTFLKDTDLSSFNNPMPRKLRMYLKGKGALTSVQIARDLEEARKAMTLCQLEFLELTIDGLLGANRDGNLLHARQMQNKSDGNRRMFKKFLSAYTGGNRDFIRNHPLTEAWVAKHPNLDVEFWTSGVELTKETSAGLLTLKIEQDPLEALKLGTYAKTCLGVGGSVSYSALATVLDVNKQVVFARDSKGNFVARQVIAISASDQLVCFNVYPENAAKEVLSLFREFARQMAKALKLELCMSGSDDEYSIDVILAKEWWDDGLHSQ